QTPAAADGSLDKSACFDDGESGKCSLINAAGCLKIVDKFRAANSQGGIVEPAHTPLGSRSSDEDVVRC
ncbi:MAG: hypothetical protein ABR866_11920, partial [Candidatus Korobacteraceae bacterium]